MYCDGLGRLYLYLYLFVFMCCVFVLLPIFRFFRCGIVSYHIAFCRPARPSHLRSSANRISLILLRSLAVCRRWPRCQAGLVCVAAARRPRRRRRNWIKCIRRSASAVHPLVADVDYRTSPRWLRLVADGMIRYDTRCQYIYIFYSPKLVVQTWNESKQCLFFLGFFNSLFCSCNFSNKDV